MNSKDTRPEDAQATEQTPLLPGSSAGAAAAQGVPTPLPKFKIALLSLTRFAEPMGFSILFPFVNLMISRLGTPTELVGYRVGLVESIYALVAAVFMIPWARASDRYGRKTCLLVALYGSAISTAMFGFSTSVLQMFFWRGLNGAFNGSTVIVRTLFAELTDKSNQARAFSFYAFAGNLALLSGPIIGGALSEPTKHLPSIFGGVALFENYPFALPGLTVCVLMSSVATLCLFFLDEPRHREQTDEKKTLWDHLTLDIVIVLAVYSMAMVLGNTYTALVPLWAYTPVKLGGLGWTPPYIAGIISFAGLFQAFWLLVLMPFLDKRIGTRALTRACFCAWPIFFVMPIFVNRLARKGDWDAVYGLMVVAQFFGAGVSMAFTTVQLLLNWFSPPEALSTLNGLALAMNALLRTGGPTFITSTFAFGINHHILGGYFAWLVLVALGCVGIATAFALPSAPARERVKASEPESGQ